MDFLEAVVVGLIVTIVGVIGILSYHANADQTARLNAVTGTEYTKKDVFFEGPDFLATLELYKKTPAALTAAE